MLWIGTALLVFVAAYVYRARQRAYRQGGLSDEHIRRILERGTVELDEPLDLSHIRDEEDRFWEEATWDEPEEH
ncbi:MAG TPA: hypothetical protein VK939_06100 [Longimicrobiales bacterium]|nr:hypothetical protein [Longimicrobiales bacterium]